MGDLLSSAEFDWDLPSPYVETVVVEPQHVDGLQHTNNAEYVRWCQQVGWGHSVALGIDVEEYQARDRGMAIRRGEYDYLQATRAGDRLLLGTWLVHCDGRLNIRRRFQIIRAEDAVTVLRGQWDLVCIELSSGRPRRMPQRFVDIYQPAVADQPAAAAE